MISFKSHIMEAIPLSTYRDKVHRFVSSDYKDRYADWFDGDWRIYLPLNNAPTDPLLNDINRELGKVNYEVADWKAGLAKSKTTTKKQRIGRLLSSLGEDELLKKFNERFSGRVVSKENEDDLLVVISRHPYDIAGQSFDRTTYEDKDGNTITHTELIKQHPDLTQEDFEKYLRDSGYKSTGWHSCKHLTDGINKHYICSEIDKGALVAYVIKKSDTNIKHPLSRILIIPVVEVDDEDEVALYVGDKYYGKYVKGFQQIVTDWVTDKQGFTVSPEDDTHTLPEDDVYNDDYTEFTGMAGRRLIESLENEGWTINTRENGRIVATTNDFTIIDQIYRTDNLHYYFTSWGIRDMKSYNDTESWEHHQLKDELEYMNRSHSDEIELLYKHYKKAGGELDDSDFFDDIDSVLSSEINDMMDWYDTYKVEQEIKGIQDAIEDDLYSNSCFDINSNNDSFELVLYCNSEDFDLYQQIIDDPKYARDYLSLSDDIYIAGIENTDGIGASEIEEYINENFDEIEEE